MKLFRRWIYVIPGYTQTRGTRTRLINLWKQAHDAFCDDSTSVQIQPWNGQWDAEAEFVSRMSDAKPSVYVVAYSWGAGWSFTQFAEKLRSRGIRIERAWLIDPVYRHRYPLGQWRVLVPSIPIKIPANVGRVTWWKQTQSIPKGHRIIATSPDTVIDPVTVVTADHVHMDDQSTIIRQVSHDLMEELS